MSATGTEASLPMAMCLTAGALRSASAATLASLTMDVISTTWLEAMSRRDSGSSNFRSKPLVMVSSSALMNTSTGAPCAICWISTPEAAKLNCSLAPGWLAS